MPAPVPAPVDLGNVGADVDAPEAIADLGNAGTGVDAIAESTAELGNAGADVDAASLGITFTALPLRFRYNSNCFRYRAKAACFVANLGSGLAAGVGAAAA